MQISVRDGAKLEVEIAGEGDPLVLVPGLATGMEAFSDLAPALAESFRVITFDPRGIGESERGTAEYTFNQLADDIAALVAEVGASPAAIFGLSMGGMVAMELALEHPEVVSALIVGATWCGARQIVPATQAARDALVGRGGKTPGDAYRIASTVLYSAEFSARHPEFIDAQVAYRGRHPVNGQVFAAQLRSRDAFNVCDRLSAITVPTLVMHGERDEVVPRANGELLARKFANAEYVEFPCGHLFFHEDLPGTVAAVTRFLKNPR